MASRSLDDASFWEGIKPLKSSDLKLMNAAKERARGDLALLDWARQGHAWRPLPELPPLGHIARVHCSACSVAEFAASFEAPNLPALVDGLAEGWPAWQGAWEPRALHAAYRHRRFRCGEDDRSYPVKVKLKHFLRYMRAQRDDSPLYIFDSMYENKHTPSQLLAEYSVPPYFREDLMALVGEHRRPPYRWMLLGPRRSGTCVHIDPLGTSAWNTLLYGRKQWVLFEPSLSREEVRGRDLVRKEAGEDDEAIDYFTNILPRLKARGGPALAARMIECVQRPGETIFVPGGWWHAVLNLDDTIAVTQNFCSSSNFDRVWVQARVGRRGMARKWLRALRASGRQDLAARADALNAAAGWDAASLAAAHRARKAALAAARAAAEARKRQRREQQGGGGGGGAGSDSDSSTSSSSSASSSSGSVTSLSSLSSTERARRQAGEGGGEAGGGSGGSGAEA
jgi:histone arginine demethylase JMJD6